MSEPFASYPYSQYPLPEPPRPRRGRHLVGLSATAAVAVAIGAGSALAIQHGGSAGGTTATSTTALSSAQIAGKIDPALVDVTSTLGYQQATAKGTGIVLSSDGLILTNNHVINGATSITVTDIGNGKTYTATVVGYDESHDIAVLRATGASGLTVASFGDSGSVSVGNNVVALGNAEGLDGTPSVAPGTVVALNQSITANDESSGSSEQLSGLIQSNAGIEPGDSGGPLVNDHGQVIGVDTAASTGYTFNGAGGGGLGSSGDGSEGADSATQGFTIPINQALSVAKQIEAGTESGSVHIGATAFLGVGINAGQTGLSQGVEIASVTAGTAAASAGLTGGDVVTSVAGHAVGTSTSIEQVLTAYHPGDKVSIAWTDSMGQSHTATVTLGTGPAA
ncbi:MAG TPA: trypsin-like peptidase domain-containing protein [Trebonia sp.]|nr:trypsin-like peptidase domain-containing protein [Trebonia sp.]